MFPSRKTGLTVPLKCRLTISLHEPPNCPRIDTRGVTYLSTLPARLRPLSRLRSVGTAAPTEPPSPHMPSAGTRRCAYTCGAPISSNDRATINRRLAHILSISFLSDAIRVFHPKETIVGPMSSTVGHAQTSRAYRCAHRCAVDKSIRWTTHEPENLQAACRDRKSTRLNSSHLGISYAVF